MADDTTYTVVEDVDTATGKAGSSSFFEGNATSLTTATGGADDTAYQVVGDLSSIGKPGASPSSFYEQGNIYEALEYAPDALTAIKDQAAQAASDRAAADADAAAALLSANNAATSSSAAAGSATGSAASAAAAAASATNAATSAGHALTSEGNAASSASAAAGSASAAATSASNANTSAGAAAGSASAASTSASNANTSAGNAAGSASAAATSASNAAASVQAAAGTAVPLVDSGTGAVGTSTKWAHEDHKHPADTATADARISNAAGTTTPLVASGTGTVGTSTKWAHADHVHPADTATADARVAAAAGTATPLVDGTAAVGVGTKWAREDHRHPTDATRAPLDAPVFTGVPKAPTATIGDNSTQIATTAFVLANASGQGAVRYDVAQTLTEPQKLQVLADLGVPFHCGYLSFVSTTAIKFAPYNGDLIKVNGLVYRIPSAGIAGVANTGVYVNGVAGQNLAPSTVYYVYTFDNAGTLTADFSTTGHGTSATAGNVGVEVKNGDNTRTLIGMICTTGSSTFVDNSAVCGVLSWFNRRLKKCAASGANVTTTSVSTVVMSAALVSMLNWSTVPVNVVLEGQSTTSGAYAQLAVGVDGATAFGATQFTYTGGPYPACIGGWDTPTEGFHNYYIIGGATSGSGTAQINNTTIYGVTFG